MRIFKKRGVEVVDLTDMQKRGLLEKTKEISETNNGLVDFSGNVETNSSDAGPVGDFLSNLASVGNSESPGEITSNLRNARKRNTENQEINELRLKLDDNEFRLSSLVEKVKELERRLNER